MEKYLSHLQKGLESLQLSLRTEQQEKLINYLTLLQKWNKIYNLTAVTDPDEIITKHILDSLAIHTYLPIGNLLDVGCGAGLPSIPLAILSPETAWVALDSQQKKINFVLQVILTLKIPNLSAVCARVESFNQDGLLFDGIVSRAFSSLTDFVSLSKRLLKPTGSLYAMKGKISAEELAAVPEGCTIEGVQSIRVPGLNAERSLVILKPFR